eukprot:1161319-Pelagomonas_calceolata.AAC.2
MQAPVHLGQAPVHLGPLCILGRPLCILQAPVHLGPDAGPPPACILQANSLHTIPPVWGSLLGCLGTPLSNALVDIYARVCSSEPAGLLLSPFSNLVGVKNRASPRSKAPRPALTGMQSPAQRSTSAGLHVYAGHL